jgi:hypothetical protein
MVVATAAATQASNRSPAWGSVGAASNYSLKLTKRSRSEFAFSFASLS